jgi:hypothetical protein
MKFIFTFATVKKNFKNSNQLKKSSNEQGRFDAFM